MPFCDITTSFNFKSAADKEALVKAVSKEVSRLARKPEAYVMVALKDGATMSMAGSTAKPVAFIRYSSLGGINPSNNKTLSGALASLLAEHCGIDPCNVYANFTDIEPSNWGYNGATF